MTWVALALAVIAAVLAIALVVALVALSRTLRSLQYVVEDLNREAPALLAALEGDARKASAGLDRVGDLVEAAESVTRRVDGASKLAYATFSGPVVKVLAASHGMSRVGRRLRGRPDDNGRNGARQGSRNGDRNGSRKA
jgi:hypothetical protein